jgi:type I restriction enzyme S subunit
LKGHGIADIKDERNYVASTGFCVVRGTSKLFNRYFYHLAFSDYLTDQLNQLAVGSNYPAVNESDIAILDIPDLSYEEQKAIATVLDTVDEAIQSTQAMLDKQDKIKQGLLHDLLTRGVDERGHLRPSPETAPDLYQKTEIGLIPKAWEASTLGKCSEVIMGQSPPGHSYNDDEKGIALVNGPVEFGKRYPRKIQWTTNPTKFCESGDILFCVRGSTTARMNISNDKYCIGRGVCAIRGKRNLSCTGYIEMILVHKNDEILSEAKGNGSTFPSINSNRLYEIPVGLPKYEEQKQIEKIYYQSLEAIESSEEHLTKLIKLKFGLMQDLLTGRKRVTPALIRDVEKLAKAA